MDPSSVEEKMVSHGDECMNSFDNEDNLLNDEIFDILFPSSPDEGTEEKDNSHNEEFHEYEFMPEEKKETEQNITQSINEETKITYKKTVCNAKCNSNVREIEYNEREIKKSTDVLISISKDNLSNTNYEYSTNEQNLGIMMNKDKFIDTTKVKSNNSLEALSNTKLEPILPTNEDLVFDYSDASLSDEEHDKSFDKLNVNLTDFLVPDEISDRKPPPSQDSKTGIVVKSRKNSKIETKNKKEYLNLGKKKIKTISKDKLLQNEDIRVNKNDSSKTKIALDNKIDISKNNGKDSKNKYGCLKNEVAKEKSNMENKKKFSNNTVCEKGIYSKSVHLKNNSECSDNGNKNINSSNSQVDGKVTSVKNKENMFTDNETNRKISEKAKETLTIEKKSPKSGNVLEEEAQRRKLDSQSKDTLEDVSDDEMEDIHNDGKKKKYEDIHKDEDILEDISDDEESQKREWATEEKGSKKRLEPVIPVRELKRCGSPGRKYDEIIIIGDERLPSLKSYKNVKIFREEGLELRNTLSFIRSVGLPHDRCSRMLILCVGLNDIIIRKPSTVCRVYKVNDKTHSPCFLFTYKDYLTYKDLFDEIMREVEKIIRYLPPSYHVKFSSLYLFDLMTINENLSLEHYHNYGHHADLSKNDLKINSRMNILIKKTNKRFRIARNGINDMLNDREDYEGYQEKNNLNFTDNTRKIMVTNIKRIQRMYSKSPSDVKESDIDKDDLRWILNKSKKKESYSIREVLNSESRRNLQADKKSANQKNISEQSSSEINRKSWHCPGQCISPTGWHPKEECRKKEQERLEMHIKRNSERSRSPRRVGSEINNEEKSRNSSRIDKEGRIYEKTGSSRGISTREKNERKSRDSRIYESYSKKRLRISERSTSRGRECSVKRQNSEKYEGMKKESPTYFDRYSQKSRSSPRTVEKELDSATCEALRNLCEVHDRSCKMYIDNPAAHPDYNKEYYEFYEAKSQKIREIGGDPLQYNFLPDWQIFWQKRSKEIFREAWLNMKNQCIQMMEEKKLKQEKKKMHEERRVQEDRRNTSKSVSSLSSSPGSSSRSSRNTHRNKRERSSDRRKSDDKKEEKSEKCNSPAITNKQNYDEKEHLISSERDLNSMKDKLQLEILIEKELKGMDKLNSTNESVEIDSTNSEMFKQDLENSHKTYFDFGKTFNFPLPSVYEENDMEDLGLEEVGESVIPFNLGKYVPESEECKDNTTSEKSNCSDSVLEVLIMLTQLGDKMGSLVLPIKTLLDKANQEDMKNRSTFNIFTDPDASIVMKLVSSKLLISIESENSNAIEKAIFQEVKNRVDKLLNYVKETFVEGVNIEHIAEKSIGMETSEIIKCIKSVLKISTSSSSFSVEKIMKIYKAVKDKQFRYIETTSDTNKCSDSLEIAFPIQPAETHNDNEINLSSTEIPFNLPTRKNSNPAEKYDPFKEEYF